jgi:hypothetical protein
MRMLLFSLLDSLGLTGVRSICCFEISTLSKSRSYYPLILVEDKGMRDDLPG